jgi:Zn-finger nucleic acid-binding protein
MADRQGVEVDYCPNCRGVWLDRGELDKLVQLGARQQQDSRPEGRNAREPRRRESWLSDIFD